MSKSPRLKNPSGGGRKRRKRSLRRSSRTSRPTCRFQVSSRPREKMNSRAESRTSPRSTSDSEDGGVGGQQPANDGDVNLNGNLTGNPTLSRAASPYHGLRRDLLTGTFRLGASGLNTARRGAYRPPRWSDQTDDSEDEDGKDASSCRPLGLRSGLTPSQKSSGGRLADIDPLSIDCSVGFDSIGGLSGHISALKEMVVFPLLYPEVFDNFKIQPPRGCLFYGPPGTGKTLVARALANECSHGNRRVSFFMRKGADCLSKWVGESERQLRLLFEQAYHMRPSIIFFDEIDGLAPVRSSRQDQIHSSVVSTLLALMDGLDSRGEVVVIGATNRLDSIDPALRRPGRFDREFLFGLPDQESRKEILKIHTRQWTPRPSEDFLEELAERCGGYCGADVRAVCTEAALCALRRRYPQIYGSPQKLLLDVSSITISAQDFAAALTKMSPASRRSSTCPAKPLSAVVHPLLGAALRDTLQALQRLFPHAKQGMKRVEPDLTSGVHDDGLTCADGGGGITNISEPKTRSFLQFARSAVNQPTSHRPRMLLVGRHGAGETSHLAPAVLHALERFSIHSLDSAVLFGVSSSSPEEVCAQTFLEAKRTAPSVLYMPRLQQWWDTAGPALRSSFLSQLDSIPSFSPVLLLATCCVPHEDLDLEIQGLFREEYGEVYTLGVPSQKERTEFFQDLLLKQAAEPPPTRKSETQVLEVLPLAPLLTPRQLRQQERLHVEMEEDVLRELRLFLRNVTERLSLDRRFRVFRQLDQEPMDLSTLLTNVEEHKYTTVGDFLSDADLIWKNVLDYSLDNHVLGALDGNVRHQACALRDAVRDIMRAELDPDLDRLCVEIREARFKRGHGLQEESNRFSRRNRPGSQIHKKKRSKRPRKSKWSTGVLPKPKKKKGLALPSLPTSGSSLTSSSEPSAAGSSDSSDGEEGRLVGVVNGHGRGMNGAAGARDRVPIDRYRRPAPATLRPAPATLLPAPATLRLRTGTPTAGRRTRAGKAADSRQKVHRGTPQESSHTERPLLVDHNKLRVLLSRVVSQTEGLEVEPLEKLYALLAQCVYTHRENADKTALLQELKMEIDCFL